MSSKSSSVPKNLKTNSPTGISTRTIKSFPPIPPGNHSSTGVYLPVLKKNGEVVKLPTTASHLARVRAIQPKGPIPSLGLRPSSAPPPKTIVQSLGKKKDWVQSTPILKEIDKAVLKKLEHGSTGRKIYKGIKKWGPVAVKKAIEYGPMIAPFLLATHTPTRMAAVQNGETLPSVEEVGLSSSNPFSNNVGIQSIKTIHTKGIVTGMRVRGIDKLGDVVNSGGLQNTAAPPVEGELVYTALLNPTTADWNGTYVSRLAKIYNFTDYHEMTFMFVSSLPATADGSLIMSINPDPDTPYDALGLAGTQIAAGREGAETDQVWRTLACTAPLIRRDKYFNAGNGVSDQRWTEPGILEVVVNTPTQNLGNGSSAIGATLGSIYVMYDMTFEVRNVGQNDVDQYFLAQANLTTVKQAFGTPTGPFGLNQAPGVSVNAFAQWPYNNYSGWVDAGLTYTDWDPPLAAPNGTLPLFYSLDDASPPSAWFSNFPPGVYVLFYVALAGTSTSFNTTGGTQTGWVVTNAGLEYYTLLGQWQACYSGYYVNHAMLKVTKQTTMPECGIVCNIICSDADQNLSNTLFMASKFSDTTAASDLSITEQLSMMAAKIDSLATGKPFDPAQFSRKNVKGRKLSLAPTQKEKAVENKVVVCDYKAEIDWTPAPYPNVKEALENRPIQKFQPNVVVDEARGEIIQKVKISIGSVLPRRIAMDMLADGEALIVNMVPGMSMKECDFIVYRMHVDPLRLVLVPSDRVDKTDSITANSKNFSVARELAAPFEGTVP